MLTSLLAVPHFLIRVFGIVWALGLGDGAHLYSQHTITIGTVFLIVSYISMLAGPLESLRKQVSNLQRSTAEIGRKCPSRNWRLPKDAWPTWNWISSRRRKVMKTRKHLGSNFDNFLREEGILEDVQAIAAKHVIAYQIAQEMKRRKVSKAALAQKMDTSRAALDRLLDPSNTSVTLQTLEHAAHALGKRLVVKLA